MRRTRALALSQHRVFAEQHLLPSDSTDRVGVCQRRVSEFEDRSGAHSRSDAHGHDAEARRPLLHLAQESCGASSSGRAQRVAQGDRPAVDVDAGVVKVELGSAV